MVENLCLHFGEPICQVDLPSAPRTFYSFPKVDALASDATEQKLRTLGFGYRAAYVQKAAKQIMGERRNVNLNSIFGLV